MKDETKQRTVLASTLVCMRISHGHHQRAEPRCRHLVAWPSLVSRNLNLPVIHFIDAPKDVDEGDTRGVWSRTASVCCSLGAHSAKLQWSL